MFGIGGPELIVIVILALLLVGPDKLPQVVKTVGTGLRDLRRAANLAQSELRETMDELVREVDLDDSRRKAQPAPPPIDEHPVAPPRLQAAQALVEGPSPVADRMPVHEPPQGPPLDGSTLAVIERRRAEPGQQVTAAAAPLAGSDLRPMTSAVSALFPAVLTPQAADGTLPRANVPRRAGSAAETADATPVAPPAETGEDKQDPT